jgi:acyl carrier protein
MTNDIEAVVKKIISENCAFEKAKEINLNDNLEDLGINSISFIKIVVSVEKALGIEFDVDHLDHKNFETLQSIIAYIEEKNNRRIS